MTQAEEQLYKELNSNYDSFEDAFESHFEGDDADRPIIAPSTNRSAGVGAKMGRGGGTPRFSAQFDVTILAKYFDVTVATGAHAAVLPAGLPAAVQTQTPGIVFGNSDFASGFAFGRNKLPLTGWVYNDVYVYGKDEPTNLTIGANTIAFPAAMKAVLQPGDMVIELYYTSGGATDNKALIIHRCQQVAYSTLLDSLGSDRFILNMLRYTIPDATKIAQFSNQIRLLRQSLFGRNAEDFVSPQSYKDPKQFQNGIIDLEMKKGIDKETLLATYLNYDVVQIDWSIFVWKTKKVLA